jgi:hypothetical protein
LKVLRVETLVAKGPLAKSSEWSKARDAIHGAVRAIDWPPGSGSFTINPVRMGNGVKPIKRAFVEKLRATGWETETAVRLASGLAAGNLDLSLSTSFGRVAIELETGNVSSCHRSMNKLAMCLQ